MPGGCPPAPLELWVTPGAGTYEEMQAECVAYDPTAHLVVPANDAERRAAVAAVQASPHGDVNFWVGYELPRGRHPKDEGNYGGENGKTMQQMGYWQWAGLGKAGEKRDWDRCVHHTTAATCSSRYCVHHDGYYMMTCSGPFPGVCQLGAGGAGRRQPPPLSPPSAPPIRSCVDERCRCDYDPLTLADLFNIDALGLDPIPDSQTTYGTPVETCNDECEGRGNDGICEDGGSADAHGGVDSTGSFCDWGTDCTDCGVRYGWKPRCTNECPRRRDSLARLLPREGGPDDYVNNGVCDDGGPGSEDPMAEGGYRSSCDWGTDCADCGPRGVRPISSPPSPPTVPTPPSPPPPPPPPRWPNVGRRRRRPRRHRSPPRRQHDEHDGAAGECWRDASQ